MNIKIRCFILTAFNVLTVSAGELRFGKHGRMLTPNENYLEQGIDSQGRG